LEKRFTDFIKWLAAASNLGILRWSLAWVVKMKDFQDIFIRFIVGGTLVVAVYILASLLPWHSLAGIFAAFPGVMAAAVSLAGWRQGDETAAEVAKGSIVGMIGSTACVLATLFILGFIKIWWVALLIAILVWFGTSLLIHWILGKCQN
jgi:hypothetical protein